MLAPAALAMPSFPLPGLLVGTLFGYLLVLYTNPARASLRDGLRCVRRYPAMWLTLGAFGFCYALFQLALRVYFHSALPPGARPEFVWLREAWRDPQLWLSGSAQSVWFLPPGSLREIVGQSTLSALESTAGIFNLLLTTFPLSAVAAFLLFRNWEGHHAVLARSLRRRFGHWRWAVHGGICLCALAALAKPLLYCAPQLLRFDPDAAELWLRWAPVVDWLSFLFEYVAGLAVQLCLMLTAYCWVRGLSFTHQHLIDFAIRRLSFVVRWALLVMLASSLLIHLPLILKNFPLFESWFSPGEAAFERRWHIARGVLTAALLLFATMQITLTFHSESLARAVRDHWRYVRRNWWPLLWFIVLAVLHFYLAHVFVACVQRGLGDGTAPGVVWSLLAPWLEALVAAWLLASWVCFYKHSDTGRTVAPHGVPEQGVLF